MNENRKSPSLLLYRVKVRFVNQLFINKDVSFLTALYSINALTRILPPIPIRESDKWYHNSSKNRIFSYYKMFLSIFRKGFMVGFPCVGRRYTVSLRKIIWTSIDQKDGNSTKWVPVFCIKRINPHRWLFRKRVIIMTPFCEGTAYRPHKRILSLSIVYMIRIEMRR